MTSTKLHFGVMPKEDRDFIQTMLQNTTGERFCVTSSKRIGLVPERALITNCVAIFNGAPVFFVLRKAEELETYRLVGDAYVNGVMQGELLQHGHDNIRQIVLV